MQSIYFREEFRAFPDATIGQCYTFNHPKTIAKTIFKLQDSGEDNGNYEFKNIIKNYFYRSINDVKSESRRIFGNS